MPDIKTKQQKAAERAEVLENMTDEEKALYRKRKTHVSMNHEWKRFFETMNGDDLKELIIGIINYDETGEMPELNNPNTFAVFVGFIKRFLDSLFDDWCYTCYTTSCKGAKGGKTKALNYMIVEQCNKAFHTLEYKGVPFAELIKDDSVGWNKLVNAGSTELEINKLKMKIADIRKRCESEYQIE